MGVYYAPPNLMQLQSAMLFVDGTNLFYRLKAAKVVVPQFAKFFLTFTQITGSRLCLVRLVRGLKPHGYHQAIATRCVQALHLAH